MNKGVTRCSLAALTALCMGAVAPARAVDVKAGNWDLSISGNVNAFATYTVCGSPNTNAAVDFVSVTTPNDTATGVMACTKTRDGSPNEFAIESGLLPSAFVFTAKTRAYDLDVSATIGLYPGLHVADTGTGDGKGTGAGDFTLDVRQNFLTFGDASWGTIKLGKDLGLFGADVILSDMTLLSVGGGTAGVGLKNHNVTLGHIGTGYIYADWLPQIAYISPNFGGAQISIAAVEGFKFAAGINEAATTNNLPGVQAKVTYDLAGGMGRIWAGGFYQHTELDTVAEPSLDAMVGELGAKVNISGLGAMLYGYYGKGVGTIQFGAAAAAAQKDTAGAITSIEGRKTYGWLAQLTYAIPNTKFRPGISWGMSYLDQESGDPDVLVHTNAMGTVALYYAATDTLTLVAEADHVRSKNWNLTGPNESKHNSFALGGIMFF